MPKVPAMPQQPAARSMTSTPGISRSRSTAGIADLLGLQVAGLVVADAERLCTALPERRRPATQGPAAGADSGWSARRRTRNSPRSRVALATSEQSGLST